MLLSALWVVMNVKNKKYQRYGNTYYTYVWIDTLEKIAVHIKKATDYDLDKIYFCIWFSCQEKCKCEYLDMAIKFKQMAEYLDCPDSMY